jgi:hypothetical protein
MNRRELRVICTDRGAHPFRDLGMIMWTPEAVSTEGSAVWDATADQSRHPAAAAKTTGRETRAGQWRPTEHGSVTTTTRADGGRTFTFPSCPKCGAPPRALRDDRLGAVLRNTPGPLDVSRLR